MQSLKFLLLLNFQTPSHSFLEIPASEAALQRGPFSAASSESSAAQIAFLSGAIANTLQLPEKAVRICAVKITGEDAQAKKTTVAFT